MKKTLVESEIAAFEMLEMRGEMGLFKLLNALEYLSIPLVYLWKFTILAFIIWVGSFMFGYKVTYTKCWQIVMIAESVFFIPELLTTLYYILIPSDPSYWDIKAFYPLSLMNLVNYELVDPRYHYVLKRLNVFEIVYWFALIYGLHWTAKKRLDTAYAIVFSSYVLVFFLWLAFYAIVYK
ncbi:sulfate ABC transporter permease [Penaeicola halotolerans]|uniref:sulfate ABC transporter permease n=1 Tax=Penaeicola halotolerans TaxID=2793196 RepID=UPI001CF8AAC4|nr:sulfate ABC transporter permease [Penaeicola halotolerans]